MITLDATVLIALLSPEDVHHDVARDYLHGAAGQVFVMHSLNIAEVLVGGVRAGRGRDMWEDLMAMGITVADPRDDEPLRLAMLRVTARLRLPDCCALDTAITTATTLATFDDALAKAARSHNVVVAP